MWAHTDDSGSRLSIGVIERHTEYATPTSFSCIPIMATTTYYIRGDYNPDRDRERLLRETGQIAEHDEQEPGQQLEPEDQDLWESMQTFGARRRLANAPRFVPAKVVYDPWNEGLVSLTKETISSSSTNRDGIADWYRSLTQRRPNNDTRDAGPTPPAPTPANSLTASPSKPLPQHPTAATSRVSKSAPASRPSSVHPPPHRINNPDWFISRALSAEASASLARPIPTSSSSLADILSRDPPVSSQPLRPPVFLHLGPSNKGWAMLQSRGWREGEGLGAGVVRRKEEDSADDMDEEGAHNGLQERQTKRAKREEEEEIRKRAKGKGKAVQRVAIKEEELEGDDEIVEVKRTEVIDLTLSDSSSDSEHAFDDEKEKNVASTTTSATISTTTLDEPSPPGHRYSNQISLLTPLPTVLKSDRLGIGLKARTEGPYRASVKRVTHNAAALKEHIKRGEETRRRKVMDGKGRRAFERAEKRKREKRREMLAYMNG